jgi:hypothetical protein
MAWSFRWYDDAHTILVCDVHDRWTWQDAYDVVQEQIRLMATVNHGPTGRVSPGKHPSVDVHAAPQ